MQNQNIILMWMPWAWKTTISKLLWEKLQMGVFDIDDDCLEVVREDTVANKLAEFWDEKFLEEEWKACLNVEKENTIIALSGSVPLHTKAMNYFRKIWTVIYLNAKTASIEKRLEEMKVDRIIWMKNNSLSDILKYRREFYENSYDIRISFWDETPEEITEIILKELKKDEWFTSTRWFENKNLDFLDVVKKWLSRDWWLFMANKFPKFRKSELDNLIWLNYRESALRTIEKFPLWNLWAKKLKKLIKDSYWTNFQNKEITPIENLEEWTFLLELFHWQTWAFKDLALQLTPKIFSESIIDDKKKYLILTATSWDTWVAAIEWFKNEKNISIIVLYPKNWVSSLQKKQMLSQSWKNILVLWVDSDFDFCQNSVKKIFKDWEFEEKIQENFDTFLGSANSINWGRLLPQVVYYVFSYLRLVEKWEIKFWEKIDVCVPSWNFWNLLAGYFAKKMWIPLWKLICAANENNVLDIFIKTWIYDLRWKKLKKTDSPSIDILNSSNIERLIFLLTWNNSSEVKQYSKDLKENLFFELKDETKEKLKSNFYSWFCTNKKSLEIIKENVEKNWYLLDTHTAVAKKVADEFKWENKMLILSTAHYSKFPIWVSKAFWIKTKWENLWEIIEKLENLAPKPEIHKKIKEVLEKEIVQKETCWENVEEIKEKIIKFLEKNS